MKIPEYLIKLFITYFYRVQGLLLGITFILLLQLGAIIDVSFFSDNNIVKSAIFLSFHLIWLFIWFFMRNYYPKIKDEKIGIIIAINSENEKQKIRIKKDFAEKLKQSLTKNNLAKFFDVAVLTDFKADRATQLINNFNDKKNEIRELLKKNQKIEKKPKEYIKWNNFQKKVKAHFFIYGSIIERLDIENKYLLSIEGLVVHKPINFKSSDKFGNEFLATLPKEISFFEKNEILGFKFTVDTVYFCIRYLVGITALISGDPNTALKLHNGLKQEIKNSISPLPPNLKHIYSKIDELLSTEKHLVAGYLYHHKGEIDKAKDIIRECLRAQYEYL